MGVLTFLAAWLGSLFGRDTDTPTAGRAWWLDKGRRTKSRLVAQGRVMRRGHGVKMTRAASVRRTRRCQEAAARQWRTQ